MPCIYRTYISKSNAHQFFGFSKFQRLKFEKASGASTFFSFVLFIQNGISMNLNCFRVEKHAVFYYSWNAWGHECEIPTWMSTQQYSNSYSPNIWSIEFIFSIIDLNRLVVRGCEGWMGAFYYFYWFFPWFERMYIWIVRRFEK